jgi:MacB-like periplasmic core domain
MAGVLREAPKEHVHMILQDLRYAVRMARRSPVFTFTAVTTLALGIGANTAIFQMIEAVGLRSLPVSNPGELAEVRIVGGNGGFGVNPGTYEGLTRPVWQELRAHQQVFSGLLAWSTRDFRVGDRSDLRRARGIAVSGEFFQVLGIQPWRGRLIEPSDELETCPSSKAVVSHAYWQRAIGGRDLDRNARLTVDLQFREVIGVTPPASAVSSPTAFRSARPSSPARSPAFRRRSTKSSASSATQSTTACVVTRHR